MFGNDSFWEIGARSAEKNCNEIQFSKKINPFLVNWCYGEKANSVITTFLSC